MNDLEKYTWIPVFQEIAQKLLDFRSKQSQLVDILLNAGVDIGEDTQADGVKEVLAEIDPFTFLALGIKGGDEKRQGHLRKILDQMEIGIDVPKDFFGVPSVQSQSAWLFSYKKDRNEADIPLLWDLFEQALDSAVDVDTFNKALQIRKVGFTKLTQYLFYFFPDDFLPVDSVTKPYLSASGLTLPEENWASYASFMGKVKETIGGRFYDVSFDAWKSGQYSQKEAVSYLTNRYGVSGETIHIVAFRNSIGKELAVDPKLTTVVKVFMELDPSGIFSFGVKHYEKNKTRHNHLKNNAPNLAYGNDAYLVTVSSAKELDILCNWYDENNTNYCIENDSGVEMTKDRKDLKLNRILYGPPGTGKTYSTVRHALEILGEKDSGIEGIQQLKDKFPGQVEFVTFHQSFSYEDFVEGLKASSLDGRISYNVEPGIFKTICNNASSKGTFDSSTQKIDSNTVIWKMSLGNSQTKDAITFFEEALENDCLVLGWGGMTDFSACKDKADVLNICEEGGSFVAEFIFGMKEGDIVIISDGNHKFKAIAKVMGPYRYDAGSDLPQKREVEWLQVFSESRPVLEISGKNFTQSTINKPKHINNKFLEEYLSNPDAIINDKPYVLIIDEINRGNISRIFGELITLIEPTKRDDGQESISIQLPYSKKSFSVPNNLYIIGTMNTSDRSLALMDTALRRRFDFIEMTPNYDLLLDDLDGIDLQEMLRIMNQRIEVLYDREHMIGHSFLMNLESLEDLKHAFVNKILPLLEEYFYDDWQKIKLVLADSEDIFYEKIPFETNLFGSMGNEVEQTESYRRATSKNLNEDVFINIYENTGSSKEDIK